MSVAPLSLSRSCVRVVCVCGRSLEWANFSEKSAIFSPRAGPIRYFLSHFPRVWVDFPFPSHRRRSRFALSVSSLCFFTRSSQQFFHRSSPLLLTADCSQRSITIIKKEKSFSFWFLRQFSSESGFSLDREIVAY